MITSTSSYLKDISLPSLLVVGEYLNCSEDETACDTVLICVTSSTV